MFCGLDEKKKKVESRFLLLSTIVSTDTWGSQKWQLALDSCSKHEFILSSMPCCLKKLEKAQVKTDMKQILCG